MLLRLLITFVVLTINVGNVFATGEQNGNSQPMPPSKDADYFIVRIPRLKFMKNPKSRTEGTKLTQPGKIRVICPGRIYNREEIIRVLQNVCTLDPTTGKGIISQMAIPYIPKINRNIPPDTSFYLWPLGKVSQTSDGLPSGFHRILFDNKCQVKDVLVEFPKLTKLLSWARKQHIPYERKDYNYVSCRISNHAE